MEHSVVLVGRPNVGKSTLFNRLTGTRSALVADVPGLTRDRQYGRSPEGFWVVDTAGADQGAMPGAARQTARAIEEAGVILLVTDAREGLTQEDERLARDLRRCGKPILLVVNKIEGLDPALACADFHRLGLGIPHPVSAAHGSGLGALRAALSSHLKDAEPEVPPQGICFTLVGRPNVGKSTLTNRILGEERVLTSDIPGTTRDSIAIPFRRFDGTYTLIDTAGLRRRAKVRDKVERFSALKTLEALEKAHVAVLVLDARQGIAEQDASLLGLLEDMGKGMVIAVNKWDGLSFDERQAVRRDIGRRLSFAEGVPLHFISALHGSGVGKLFPSIKAVYRQSAAHFSTAGLTRLLQEAVASHPPPRIAGRPIKLRYAHQGGEHPPVIVIHGHRTEAIPPSYRRYLANRLRKGLGLTGVPLKLAFKSTRNPYVA